MLSQSPVRATAKLLDIEIQPRALLLAPEKGSLGRTKLCTSARSYPRALLIRKECVIEWVECDVLATVAPECRAAFGACSHELRPLRPKHRDIE